MCKDLMISSRAPTLTLYTEDASLKFQYHKPHLVLLTQLPPTRAASVNIKAHTPDPIFLYKWSSSVVSPCDRRRLITIPIPQATHKVVDITTADKSKKQYLKAYTSRPQILKWSVADFQSVYLIFIMGGWPPPNPR